MSDATPNLTSAPALGKLTTHVLDTVNGAPAAGMKIELYVREASPDGCSDGHWLSLRSVVTNADGRLDGPLLTGDDFKPGCYRLIFDVETYFRGLGADLPKPAFLGKVPLDFGVADASAHYHVPLLVSPWAYSSYRGS
jgi:5-hydroxyisourate hydrolase